MSSGCGQTKNSPQFSSWILIGSNQANFARIIPDCYRLLDHHFALLQLSIAAAAPSFVTLTLSWELLAAGDKRQFTKLHECSESAQAQS